MAEEREQPGGQVSDQWAAWRARTNLDEYEARWERIAGGGGNPHGEADLVCSFAPRSVLDAGCGMGRVAIELARRGLDVVGVELDADMLHVARRHAPELTWVHADLATLDLGRRVDVVVMPGNVMIYCRVEDRAPIVERMAAHLEPGGRLIAGFNLDPGPHDLTLDEWTSNCGRAGLEPESRWSTWDRQPFIDGGLYVVTVDRRPTTP
jgi:SAM-dependent methyltransferase